MELSAGPIPALSISYSAFLPFLPARYRSAPASTPVLSIVDLSLTVFGLTLVIIEYTADDKMFSFQSSKHSDHPPSEMVHPPKPKSGPNTLQPAAYPRSHHPGFPTKGLFKWARHPNFAAEQLFWVNQAMFVAAAGESSEVTRSGWVSGGVFGPCFAVSRSSSRG